jgi:hypothetical protein
MSSNNIKKAAQEVEQLFVSGMILLRAYPAFKIFHEPVGKTFVSISCIGIPNFYFQISVDVGLREYVSNVMDICGYNRRCRYHYQCHRNFPMLTGCMWYYYYYRTR